jgi:hypothetical protein
MWRSLMLRLQSLSARYGETAPAACCGVCKPCVTTAATGLVVGAVGLTVERVAERRLGGERDGARSGESAGELGEDRQVGVQPHPVQATHA